MLRSMNDLHSFTLSAKDGEIGAVEDVCFDDARWTIRCLIVDAGNWLPGRRVLISPATVQGVDWDGQTVSVALTRDQVKVTSYHGLPSYSTLPPVGHEEAQEPSAGGIRNDPHLRRAHEVTGYYIDAQDGPVGHVSDFIFDDMMWVIEFMVVDAGNWLHKRLVLVKPEWIQSINWAERHVVIGLNREMIKLSPEFVPVFPISLEYTEQLLRHYHGAE